MKTNSIKINKPRSQHGGAILVFVLCAAVVVVFMMLWQHLDFNAPDALNPVKGTGLTNPMGAQYPDSLQSSGATEVTDFLKGTPWRFSKSPNFSTFSLGSSSYLTLGSEQYPLELNISCIGNVPLAWIPETVNWPAELSTLVVNGAQQSSISWKKDDLGRILSNQADQLLAVMSQGGEINSEITFETQAISFNNAGANLVRSLIADCSKLNQSGPIVSKPSQAASASSVGKAFKF